MPNDLPHNDWITDQQEGGAGSKKLATGGGRAVSYDGGWGGLQEDRAVGGELLEGISELLASY